MSQEIYQRAAESYRVLVAPDLDPSSPEVFQALCSMEASAPSLPLAWFTPELTVNLLHLARTYLHPPISPHSAKSLLHLVAIWSYWLQHTQIFTPTAIESLEVCSQILLWASADRHIPLIPPTVTAMAASLDRFPPSDVLVKERVLTAIMGWITSADPTDVPHEAILQDRVILLLTSSNDPLIIKRLSRVLLDHFPSSPPPSFPLASGISRIYTEIARRILALPPPSSLLSYLIAPSLPSIPLIEALIESIPWRTGTHTGDILIKLCAMGGILIAFDPPSAQDLASLHRICAYAFASMATDYSGKQDRSMETDAIFSLSFSLGVNAFPALCAEIRGEALQRISNIVISTIIHHPLALGGHPFRSLDDNYLPLDRTVKLSNLETRLKEREESDLYRFMGTLSRTAGHLASVNPPSIAMDMLLGLSSFVDNTTLEFSNAETTLGRLGREGSDIFHPAFRYVQVLLKVVVRFVHTLSSRAPYDPHERVEHDPAVLSMLANLHFLLPTLGSMGAGPSQFTIMRDYQSIMLAIALHLRSISPHALSTALSPISPPPGCCVEDRQSLRGRVVFFLDLAEQFADILQDSFIRATAIPAILIYLDEPTYPDAFGSTHSLILSLFARGRLPMIAFTPAYAEYLLKTFPEGRLTFDQFHGAFGVMIEFLAPHHSDLAWSLTHLLIQHTLSLPTGMSPTNPKAIARADYLFTLATLIRVIPYSHLPALLSLVASCIEAEDPGPPRDNALKRVWEGFSQDLGLERKEMVVKWWLDIAAHQPRPSPTFTPPKL